MKLLAHLIILSGTLLVTGCSEQYSKVSLDKFEGTWELQGRKMFNGIVVTITRNEGRLSGKIDKLNDNKYVQLFAEVGDVWISEITRSSNFQFRITEKKIGRELFSMYGLSSSSEFKAVFIDENTIGLSGESGDPFESPVVYKKIN